MSFPEEKEVSDQWVFVLDQWVFVLDQRVFVLDQWVFVLDLWVFVLDHRVFIFDTSALVEANRETRGELKSTGKRKAPRERLLDLETCNPLEKGKQGFHWKRKIHSLQSQNELLISEINLYLRRF